MTLQLVVSVALLLALFLIAKWSDPTHLVAAITSWVLVGGLRLDFWLRNRPRRSRTTTRRRRGTNWTRNLLLGVILGGITMILTLVISAGLTATGLGHSLDDVLRGPCLKAQRELDILASAGAWPRAISQIDHYLSQPSGYGKCQNELMKQRHEYLVEWVKALNRQGQLEEACRRADEGTQWAERNHLDSSPYRLLRQTCAPTPTPAIVIVTPTPLPIATPQTVEGSAQLVGIDNTQFPPALVAYLKVTDRAGKPITSLRPSDFRVFDDRLPVRNFSVALVGEARPPICAALLLDYSGSMAGQPITAAMQAADVFLSLLGPDDQVEVLGFANEVHKLQGWTSDKQDAARAMRRQGTGGWTVLRDAIWEAANDLEGCQGRRAIIALTDGKDYYSTHSHEQVIEQAKAAGAELFVIGLRGSEGLDTAALDVLAASVGGRSFYTGSLAELEECYRAIAGELQNEYRFVLMPDRIPDGRQHQLRIEVGGSLPLVAEQTYQDRNP